MQMSLLVVVQLVELSQLALESRSPHLPVLVHKSKLLTTAHDANDNSAGTKIAQNDTLCVQLSRNWPVENQSRGIIIIIIMIIAF